VFGRRLAYGYSLYLSQFIGIVVNNDGDENAPPGFEAGYQKATSPPPFESLIPGAIPDRRESVYPNQAKLNVVWL
jgi:hypothetical protein